MYAYSFSWVTNSTNCLLQGDGLGFSFDELVLWYGRILSGTEECCFYPWPVLCALERRILGYYWCASGKPLLF